MTAPMWLIRTGWAGVALVATRVPLGQFFGDVWWCDLLSHFKLHYAIGALLIAVPASIFCQRRLAAAALLVLTANAVPVARAAVPAVPAPAKPELTIYSQNLYARRDDPTPSFNQAIASGADVLVFPEFREGWLDRTEQLRTHYPFYFLTGNYTIDDTPRHALAVFSRLPLSGGKALLTSGGLPRPFAIRMEIDVGGAPVAFYAVHILHELYPSWAVQRRFEDAALHAALRAEARPERVVGGGDVNATPFSQTFGDSFPAAGPLHRAGGYPVPTWPAILGPLGLPIDHALVGDGLAADVTVLDAAGSDHRALLVRVSSRVPPGP